MGTALPPPSCDVSMRRCEADEEAARAGSLREGPRKNRPKREAERQRGREEKERKEDYEGERERTRMRIIMNKGKRGEEEEEDNKKRQEEEARKAGRLKEGGLVVLFCALRFWLCSCPTRGARDVSSLLLCLFPFFIFLSL